MGYGLFGDPEPIGSHRLIHAAAHQVDGGSALRRAFCDDHREQAQHGFRVGAARAFDRQSRRGVLRSGDRDPSGFECGTAACPGHRGQRSLDGADPDADAPVSVRHEFEDDIDDDGRTVGDRLDLVACRAFEGAQETFAVPKRGQQGLDAIDIAPTALLVDGHNKHRSSL